MAQNIPENAENLVCRYFLRASCYAGNDCPISHIPSPDCVPDNICRQYLDRRCRKGKNCKYQHVRIPIYFKILRQNRAVQYPASLDVNNAISKGSKAYIQTKKSISCSPKPNLSKTNHSDWVNAAEFIPKQMKSDKEGLEEEKITDPNELKSKDLCYYLKECCPNGKECSYIHGDACDICGYVCLHPYDEQQRSTHREKCIQDLVEEMDFSFAVQRSMGKMCGICMDIIIDKERVSDRRFGILENCNHIFCLKCIQKWRSAKKFENRQHSDGVLDPFVTRACPECRRPSDFVTPSSFWFENEEDKKKMMEDYKTNLSKKHCKYFKRGEGVCYFGSSCFYLHAKPDGTVVKLPPPVRRRRSNQNRELELLEDIILGDLLFTREENLLIRLDLSRFYNITLPESDDFSMSALPENDFSELSLPEREEFSLPSSPTIADNSLLLFPEGMEDIPFISPDDLSPPTFNVVDDLLTPPLPDIDQILVPSLPEIDNLSLRSSPVTEYFSSDIDYLSMQLSPEMDHFLMTEIDDFSMPSLPENFNYSRNSLSESDDSSSL